MQDNGLDDKVNIKEALQEVIIISSSQELTTYLLSIT